MSGWLQKPCGAAWNRWLSDGRSGAVEPKRPFIYKDAGGKCLETEMTRFVKKHLNSCQIFARRGKCRMKTAWILSTISETSPGHAIRIQVRDQWRAWVADSGGTELELDTVKDAKCVTGARFIPHTCTVAGTHRAHSLHESRHVPYPIDAKLYFRFTFFSSPNVKHLPNLCYPLNFLNFTPPTIRTLSSTWGNNVTSESRFIMARKTRETIFIWMAWVRERVCASKCAQRNRRGGSLEGAIKRSNCNPPHTLVCMIMSNPVVHYARLSSLVPIPV